MEMQEKDQPPEAIWLNDELLTEHFERVRNSYSLPAGSEPVPPAGGLDQNELTKGLR
jgi:hypothetical protein